MIRNPWVDLPEPPPYVLDCDRLYVDEFNATAKPEHVLDLTLLPENVTGRRDAPVLFLQLNPGMPPMEDVIASTPELAEVVLGNIGDDECRHINAYLTDPFVERGLGNWWLKKLRYLIDACGIEKVALGVTCVEFHGYHSKSYAALPITLPSQHYGFDVVRSAMARGAFIIVSRAPQAWNVAVPGLRTYPGRVKLINAQNPTISPNNCVGDGFERIVQAVLAWNPSNAVEVGRFFHSERATSRQHMARRAGARNDATRVGAKPSRDYTRFEVLVDGTSLGSMNKKNSILEMVRQLSLRGVPASIIRAAMPPRESRRAWRVVDGIHGDRAGVESALRSQDAGIDVERWHVKAPLVDEAVGLTFVVSTQWGRETEATLTALSEAFPQTGVTARKAGDQ